MELEDLIKEYADEPVHRRQSIFASIFILQNRLQTACDKIDPDITMKQWLLLAVAETNEQAYTLTELGRLMGCSRQNVKKIALALEKKGFIKLGKKEGDSRAVCVLQEGRMKEYASRVGRMQKELLELLFQEFTEEEIIQFFRGMSLLHEGVKKVEKYVEENHE